MSWFSSEKNRKITRVSHFFVVFVSVNWKINALALIRIFFWKMTRASENTISSKKCMHFTCFPILSVWRGAWLFFCVCKNYMRELMWTKTFFRGLKLFLNGMNIWTDISEPHSSGTVFGLTMVNLGMVLLLIWDIRLGHNITKYVK